MINNRINTVRQCKSNDDLYTKGKTGFYRRVNVSSFHFSSSKIGQSEIFQDNFQIDFDNSEENPSKKLKPRRLYNVYEREEPIFNNYSED